MIRSYGVGTGASKDAGARAIAAGAEYAGRELAFRVFLDPDEVGRLGSYDLVIARMRLLGSDATFGIEVIIPPPLDEKAGRESDAQ